jgi:hypothetical protein
VHLQQGRHFYSRQQFGPALALLYRLDLTDRLAADHDEDLVEAPESPRS